MIDFTKCKKLKKSYGGANGSKICIEYDGDRYMLKFPSVPTKKTELSYANGCVSEYISCNIYNMLGIEAQKTLLGCYDNGIKKKMVVACKDFTSVGIVLQDFASLKNQVIDSENNGYGTELSSILNGIDLQQSIDPYLVKKRFWDMFVIDALLGNFDRHNGNWGFLYNEVNDELSIAPVYDCGSCLYPQADKTTIQKILNNEGERNNRIYNYPTSAIRIDNKKISYHTFLLETEDSQCLSSLSNIYENIDIARIHDFINGINEIDDLQKSFYTTMIKERYDKILTPAYDKVKRLEVMRDSDDWGLYL